jgi:fructose-bisphosphate aldolase, class I
VIQKARVAMDAGATGLIFGRNVWQRPFEEALELSQRMHEMLKDYGA